MRKHLGTRAEKYHDRNDAAARYIDKAEPITIAVPGCLSEADIEAVARKALDVHHGALTPRELGTIIRRADINRPHMTKWDKERLGRAVLLRILSA